MDNRKFVYVVTYNGYCDDGRVRFERVFLNSPEAEAFFERCNGLEPALRVYKYDAGSSHFGYGY